MKNWIMGWVLDWLAEKTTWAGFASLAASQGLNLAPQTEQILVALAVSFFAMPDRKNLPK